MMSRQIFFILFFANIINTPVIAVNENNGRTICLCVNIHRCDQAYITHMNKKIHVISAEGVSQYEQLRSTPTDSPLTSCSWSPDDTQIVTGSDEIFIIGINDYGLHNITNNPANDYSPSWSPVLEKEPTIVEETVEVPEQVLLKTPYPNPFNPTTTIEFILPGEGFVDLVIYNIMGQKIRELVAEKMTPGVHSVVWDGKDDAGMAVSSGIYLLRLKAGNAVETKRMLLMK
ncbi:hypothetical protein ES708_24858 [subsurface metagenome]